VNDRDPETAKCVTARHQLVNACGGVFSSFVFVALISRNTAFNLFSAC